MTMKTPAAAGDPSDLLIAIPSGAGWTDAQGARLAELVADRSDKAKRERLKILRAAPDRGWSSIGEIFVAKKMAFWPHATQGSFNCLIWYDFGNSASLLMWLTGPVSRLDGRLSRNWLEACQRL